MKKTIFVLILILILAFALRFWKLTSIPMGFMDDEASIGYNAYSILKTGKDEWGKFMPIDNFKGSGEYKLPLTIYLTVLPEVIFGLNEFAVRFPSAFFGVLTILATFLLAQKMFSEKVALLAAFLLAISPWHIFLNRFGHEANIALFFTILGFYLLLKSQKEEKFLPVSLLFFVLTLYTYHAYQLFLPFFLLIFVWLNRNWFWQLKRRTKISCLAVLVLVLPLFIALFSHGQVRFQQVGIFSTPGLPLGIQRPLTLMRIFFQNYLLNFSIFSLFTSSRFDQKHVTPMALFYLFEFPLILIGFFNLLKKKDKTLSFLVPWLFLYPLPNSLTQFGAIARMFVWLPLPQILSAVGIVFIWQKLSLLKKFARFSLTFVFILIVIFSFTRFVFDYFLYYPIPYAPFSQYGRKTAFQYLTTVERDYQYILVEGAAVNYIQLAFFAKHDPALFQKERDKFYFDSCAPVLAKIKNWYVVSLFPPECLSGDELLLFYSENFPKELTPLEVINYPNGDPLAKIIKAEDYLRQQREER